MEVRNPKYATPDNLSIDIEINHPVYGWIPFTANPNDVEEHGRALFLQASSGEFGEISAYIPPSIEILSKNARAERDERLLIEVDPIVLNSLRWNDLSQSDKDLIAVYRRALLDLPQQSGFPTQIDWPVYPL